MEEMENRVHEVEVNLEKMGELFPDEMGAGCVQEEEEKEV